MRVYLQYPWRFPDSAYYRYLVSYPPKGITFVNANKDLKPITSKRKFLFSNFAKRFLRNMFKFLHIPLPNVRYTFASNFDLIHCAHCLSLNKKPWVADFEDSWQFFISNAKNPLAINFAKKLVLSEHCKKILPWSNYAARNIALLFRDKCIDKKLTVLYPALPLPKLKVKKEPASVLFVARYFWLKGGLFVLEVMKKLVQTHKANCYVVADVPAELKEKYKGINFLPLMPQEKLFELYKRCEIFLYPSVVDTFGFSLLEAMAFGLAIVSIDDFRARSELIENNRTGILLKRPKQINCYKLSNKERALVKKLYDACVMLIEDSALREKLTSNARKEIARGKFSLKVHNKKLKQIYEEAACS